MDRGAWKAVVYGVTKSQTRLKYLVCTQGCFCAGCYKGGEQLRQRPHGLKAENIAIWSLYTENSC